MRPFRWPTWRRDLAAGLIGSMLTAAAIGSLAWVGVRDQRRKLDEQEARLREQEAEVESLQAREQAARQSAEGIARFMGPAFAAGAPKN